MGKPNCFKKFLKLSEVTTEENLQPSVPCKPPGSLCRIPLLTLLLCFCCCTAESGWDRKWRDNGNCCHFPAQPSRGQESSYYHLEPSQRSSDCSFYGN